jgi:hypothetical protein
MKSPLRWKKVCVPFLIALASGAALAAGESPVQALAQLPPLPKVATGNLDCSLGETVQKKVNEVALRETASGQAAAQGPMVTMNDAQVAAMQAMTEPAYNTCPIDVMQPEAQGWATTAEDKLTARLEQIAAARVKASEEWCTKHPGGEMCAPDPAIAKRANADATAAGTQFLKDAQPGYAKFLKQVTDCVVMRDKAVVAAGAVKGPFRMMVGGAHAQNWGLVGVAADAHSKACMKAREAAQQHLQ